MATSYGCDERELQRANPKNWAVADVVRFLHRGCPHVDSKRRASVSRCLLAQQARESRWSTPPRRNDHRMSGVFHRRWNQCKQNLHETLSCPRPPCDVLHTYASGTEWILAVRRSQLESVEGATFSMVAAAFTPPVPGRHWGCWTRVPPSPSYQPFTPSAIPTTAPRDSIATVGTIRDRVR